MADFIPARMKDGTPKEPNMNDLELLKAAAKAAGIVCLEEGGVLWIDYGVDMREWNPLDDDAEAFRLAVKLGFEVSVAYAQVYACRFGMPDKDAVNEPFGIIHGLDTLDRYAAARRAIVRAAAATA